jgi:hypothetical protein
MKFFISHILEPLSFLIYFGAFFWYARMGQRKPGYRLITIYYLLATGILFLAALRYVGYKSNTFYYNLLYPITSVGFAGYFFSLFKTRFKRTIALTVSITTLTYFIINLNEIYFDSLGYVISSTGIVLLIFLYLHQLLTNVSDDPLANNFDFWYICVQLMYHLGSFAIFLSYNYFTYRFLTAGDDKKSIGTLLTYLWIIHNIILFIGALVICYAVARAYRKEFKKLPIDLLNR